MLMIKKISLNNKGHCITHNTYLQGSIQWETSVSHFVNKFLNCLIRKEKRSTYFKRKIIMVRHLPPLLHEGNDFLCLVHCSPLISLVSRPMLNTKLVLNEYIWVNELWAPTEIVQRSLKRLGTAMQGNL